MYVNVNWEVRGPDTKEGSLEFLEQLFEKGAQKWRQRDSFSLKSQLTYKHVRTQCNKAHLLTAIHMQLAGTVTSEFSSRPS